MEANLVIFIDFDGTISLQDVSNAMLSRFCSGDWQSFNKLWEQGRMSTSECAASVLALMRASEQELAAFFDEQEIDPAFPAFLNWAYEQDYPVYILSDGFDNYIRLILERFQLDVPHFANHLHYSSQGGWTMESPFADRQCAQCGVCKKNLVEFLRTDDSLTVYIGDGYSDACAAPDCDLIFARDQLDRILTERKIPHVPFADFAEILDCLQALISRIKK